MLLPEILRQGIRYGEVPTRPDVAYCERPSAANLTANGEPFDQLFWAGHLKIMVRLTIEMPETDVTPFREIIKRYQIRASWLKKIAPYHARRNWYFAFDGVLPSQIVQVETLTESGYQPIRDEELTALVKDIEAEMVEKWEEFRFATGQRKGARGFRLKSEFSESWLSEMPDWFNQRLGQRNRLS